MLHKIRILLHFLLKILCISNIFSNFAAESCKDMRNDTDIFSLESTLSAFFDCVTKSNQKVFAYPYLDAMTTLFHGETNALIVPFALDDESTVSVIAQLKEHLQPYIPELLKSLNMPLTYLLDELICNIQQHAQTDKNTCNLMYQSY